MHRSTIARAAAAALAATALAGVATADATPRAKAHKALATPAQILDLTPSSAQLAGCMPGARLTAIVREGVDTVGFDTFKIKARRLPPNRDYTVFLLEQAGAPFGAASYIGDFTTNKHGNARNEFRLIVSEAFASTLVDGKRVRVDLNRVGVWFADPADDEFCLPGSGATPFDGDDEAGVQAFNSAGAEPLPAP